MTSISRQLVFWLATPLLVLASCGALIHYFNNVAPGVISGDQRLKAATSALMARVSYRDGRLQLEALPDADSAPRLPAADTVIYALRDPQGRLLAGDAELPVIAVSDETHPLFTMSELRHRTFRTLTTRFQTANAPVLITVADLVRAAEPAARYGFMSTLLWDFVQLDVTLVLVWVGIHLGLRPLKKLRHEIAARSPLDLRPIDESFVPREISPVVVTLNRLFTTLRASIQSQQQFIANTAHQLRTPITGLQAQLQLLINEPVAAPVQERLLTLQEGIRQLAHSANQLLALARADPSVNMIVKTQTVALDEIVAEVVARFFDRALQSDIDLGVEAQTAFIQADPSLIDDLLSNLVDNALKYTPRGGRATVSTGKKQGQSYLAVEDSGPGIPEIDRQRVLQRFYRLPNSPGHGSGLGLAIVDEIAKLYGGQVIIGTGSNGIGCCIVVQFP